MKHFTFLDTDGRRCYSDCADDADLPDYAECWLPRAPLPDEEWDGNKLVWMGDRAKGEAVARINAEAERRILRDYPWHKQMNDITDPLAVGKVGRIDRKNEHRAWSNGLCARVARAKNGAEIDVILAELSE